MFYLALLLVSGVRSVTRIVARYRKGERQDLRDFVWTAVAVLGLLVFVLLVVEPIRIDPISDLLTTVVVTSRLVVCPTLGIVFAFQLQGLIGAGMVR